METLEELIEKCKQLSNEIDIGYAILKEKEKTINILKQLIK